jgi:hypothetical protein
MSIGLDAGRFCWRGIRELVHRPDATASLNPAASSSQIIFPRSRRGSRDVLNDTDFILLRAATGLECRHTAHEHLNPLMLGLGHPRFPSIIMFHVQLEPTLFATDDRWWLAKGPSDVSATLIQGIKPVELLEFNRLFDGQTDQNAPSFLIDIVSPRRRALQGTHSGISVCDPWPGENVEMALVAPHKSGDKGPDNQQHNQPRHSNAPQTQDRRTRYLARTER